MKVLKLLKFFRTREYQSPYEAPPPRLFTQWLQDLGLTCDPPCPVVTEILDYDEFLFYAGIRLRKTSPSDLYGFWRQYGDVLGEPRTVEEWLVDLRYEVVDATEQDLSDMNLVLGFDEFMTWSAGKVTDRS